MRTDNLPFPEAIEKLANEAGIQLPTQTRQSREDGQVRQSLHVVLEAAAEWFAAELDGPRGRAGKEYLLRRGIGNDVVERFRIGFAPEARGMLKAALTKQGFTEQLLIEAGLLRRRDESGEVYDLFRNRVMFPITDRRGQVIAFGGRVLEPAPPNAPKYLNSPETRIFQKGHVLFGHAEALPLAREHGRLFVTEGYLDAIALLRVGIPAVAPLGTALTDEQIQLLWRIVPEPTLCFDGDNAGLRALERAAFKALAALHPGKSLYLARLPAGEDPDSIIRNQGSEAFEQIVAAAKPLSEAVWDLVRARHRIDTPEHIAAFRAELESSARLIPDSPTQWTFLSYFRNRVWEATRIKYDNRQKGGKPRVEARIDVIISKPDPLGTGIGGTSYKREEKMVGTIIKYPLILEEHLDSFLNMKMFTPEYNTLREAIAHLYSREIATDPDALARGLEEQGFGQTIRILFGPGGRLFDWYFRIDAPMGEVETAFLTNLRMQERFALFPELEDALQAFAENPTEATLSRFEALRSELDVPIASDDEVLYYDDIRRKKKN